MKTKLHLLLPIATAKLFSLCKAVLFAGALMMTLHTQADTQVDLATPAASEANDLSVKQAVASTFNYEEFKQVLSGTTSVESLLPLLPRDFRASYALIFHSRSLQAAAPLAPRVILFSQGAEFILTFNGGGDAAGAETVELMSYNPAVSRFEFREVSWPSKIGHDSQSFTISEVNPVKCMRCHTSSLVPNWAPYFTWPGAYGSVQNEFIYNVDGTPDEAHKQLDDFERFQTLRKSHPRYRFLQSPPDQPLWPFAMSSTRASFEADQPLEFAPNRRLGVGLGMHQARALATQIEQSDAYQKLPASVLYLMLCDDFAGNSDLTQSSFGPATVAKSLREILAFNDRDDVAPSTQSDTPAAHALLSLLGELSETWELDPSQRSPVDKFPSFFAGFSEMSQTVPLAALALLSDMSAKDQATMAIAKQLMHGPTERLLDASGMNVELGEALNAVIPFALRQETQRLACPLLMTRSQQELALGARQMLIITPRHRKEVPTGTSPSASAPSLRTPPLAFKRCISCHSASEQTKAPFLSFAQPDVLREELNSTGFRRGTLYQEILYRISDTTDSSERMPYLAPALSKSEQTAIKDYLSHL
jgi:hypothetical protein